MTTFETYQKHYGYLIHLDIFYSEIKCSFEIHTGAGVAKQVDFGAFLVLVGLILIQLDSSEQFCIVLKLFLFSIHVGTVNDEA